MLRVNGYAVESIKYNGAVITDKVQRLKQCRINRQDGVITYKVEGDNRTFEIEFEENGAHDVTFIWPDGHECEVSFE